MSSAADQKKAMEIFVEICDIPPHLRSSKIDALCGNDPSLKQAVLKMLRADEQISDDDQSEAAVSGFLERSLDQLKAEETQASIGNDARGGQYRIIRVIGEGGMGTVYEAEQVNPRRRVAIKAIRSFLGSPALRRRFEFEAQVLARLEHPGIARLYEADLRTGDRDVHAYLAMEFVDGVPIDEYADRKKLSLRERLELFVRLCEPVEYAHRMGVIHRDLKPANLFVQDDGQIKVLDFGIARSVADGGRSMMTLTGQVVGTLAYMSPEQLEAEPEIDTRADVYALGVIFYQLLSGKLPIDVRSDSLIEASRRIRAEHPAPLEDLNKSLRGDLSIIATKALEKDRNRRYASARDLSEDVQRYLDNRPILARGDSTFYLLRKALWRYRAIASVVLLGVATLTLFSVMSSIHARRNAALAHVAEEARLASEKSQQQTQRLLYFSNIGFAQAALENNDMERVHTLLDGCDTSLRNWEWRYLNRLCDLSSLTRPLKMDRPRYASFTADRGLGVFASLGREITLIDLQTGQELLRRSSAEGAMRAALSPDGHWLVYGSSVNTLTLRNLKDGTERTLPYEQQLAEDPTYHSMRVVAFTADSSALVTAGLDRALRVWDPQTLQSLHSIALGNALPICMVLSADGQQAFVGDNRFGLRSFDLKNGQLVREYAGHDAPVWSLALSPDGKWLASGDNDGRVVVREVATGTIVAQMDTNDGWFTSLCFNPQGDVLALGRSDATIRLLSLPTTSVIGVLRGHRHAIVSMHWRDAGLESVSLDGTIKNWLPQSALQVPTIETKQSQTIGLALSPDESTVFSGGIDGTVIGYSLDTLASDFAPKVRTTFPTHDGHVLEVVASRATNQLLTTGRDGKVRVGDIATGTPIHVIDPAEGPISALDVTSDGKRIVFATPAGIRLYDLGTGTLIEQYQCPAVTNELRFKSDNTFYAVCSDGHLRRYQVGVSSPDVDVPLDPTGLYDICLSQDGKWIVTAGDSASVVLLDAQTHKEVRRFVGHQGPVFGVAFHPDGTRLASCGSDRSIRIWDVDTATELVSLRGHRRLVQHIQFTRDGTTLASTSDDGTIRLWRAK